MGTVSRMIRKRERRQNPRRGSPWDLLWVPASFAVYIVGASILPRWGGAWKRALLWAAFGAAWVLFVAVADHLMRRRRERRRLADAARPRERARAWRSALCFSVFLVAVQVQAEGAGFYQVAILVVASFLIVLVERAVSAVAQRRDAERRRKEIADLARQF